MATLITYSKLRKGAALSICLLWSLVPSGGAEPDGQLTMPLFHATSQTVLVPVTVTDRSNRIVEGLRSNDLLILDNKLPQRISWFAAEDAPSSIGIVLDVSGSMRTVLPTAKMLLDRFIGVANPEDEFMLSTVSTDSTSAPGFTDDLSRLKHAIEIARPGGLTSLFDASYAALKRMKEGRRARRGLIILSDGKDNYSRRSFAELANLAVEADVQIYTTIFDTAAASTDGLPFRLQLARKPWDREVTGNGPELLEKLSGKTGGLAFHVRSSAEAEESALRISRALRTEYLVGFEPSDAAANEKRHQLSVKCLIPHTSVHARNTYYSRN